MINTRKWRNLFQQIENAVLGLEDWPPLRQCAMAWYVSGILYEGHNNAILKDTTYDKLSAYLCDNLEEARKQGAGLLQEWELEAGTAMNWKEYIKPYHVIAEALDR